MAKWRKEITAGRRAEESMRRSSGGEAAYSAEQELFMKSIGEKDAKELDDAGKEDVSLRSGGIGGFSMGHAKHRLEGANGTLHRNPLDDVESAPVVRIAEDTRVKALVGVWVDVNAPPIGGGGAGLVTAAAPGHTIGGLDALGLWTDKFETHRAVLALANAVTGQDF